jgi:hypothetical protein
MHRVTAYDAVQALMLFSIPFGPALFCTHIS